MALTLAPRKNTAASRTAVRAARAALRLVWLAPAMCMCMCGGAVETASPATGGAAGGGGRSGAAGTTGAAGKWDTAGGSAGGAGDRVAGGSAGRVEKLDAGRDAGSAGNSGRGGTGSGRGGSSPAGGHVGRGGDPEREGGAGGRGGDPGREGGAGGSVGLGGMDGGDADAGCPVVVVPDPEGDTVGWMASQCAWTKGMDPDAPAVHVSLSSADAEAGAGARDVTSFRIRVDLASEVYAHGGYVSAPSLVVAGPVGARPGMSVGEPESGSVVGQYFFKLVWVNEYAPREGMGIALTLSFSFACSPEMSRTTTATTTAEVVLCHNAAVPKLVWRAPGETCERCSAEPP